jgi:hypothetical protein
VTCSEEDRLAGQLLHFAVLDQKNCFFHGASQESPGHELLSKHYRQFLVPL